jgi:hypothetical protein
MLRWVLGTNIVFHINEITIKLILLCMKSNELLFTSDASCEFLFVTCAYPSMLVPRLLTIPINTRVIHLGFMVMSMLQQSSAKYICLVKVKQRTIT